MINTLCSLYVKRTIFLTKLKAHKHYKTLTASLSGLVAQDLLQRTGWPRKENIKVSLSNVSFKQPLRLLKFIQLAKDFGLMKRLDESSAAADDAALGHSRVHNS